MKLFLLGHLDIHTPFDGVVIQIGNILILISTICYCLFSAVK